MDQVNSTVLVDVSAWKRLTQRASRSDEVTKVYSDLGALCVSLLCKVGELVTRCAKAGAFAYD